MNMQQLFKITIIGCLFVTTITIPVHASTYYVRPDGSDSNTGYSNDDRGALKTIQKAADISRPGDIIEIQPGIYKEAVVIKTSGNELHQIAFHGNGEAIIDAQNDSDFCIKLDNVKYVRIEGITCRNALRSGIVLTNSSRNFLVRNFTTSTNDSANGIEKDDSSKNNIITGNISSAVQVSRTVENQVIDEQSALGSSLDKEIQSNDNKDSKLFKSKADEGGNKAPSFAPGEIIVKLKKDITSALSATAFGISSIDKLNAKFQITSIDKVFKGRPSKTLKSKARHMAVDEAKLPNLSNIYRIKLKNDSDVLSAISEYRNDPNVEYAEPNYVVTAFDTYPNDPSFTDQWALYNTGQNSGTAGADIDAPEAWDITTGSPDVVIAIVDTGVDYNHEDLAANIWTNPGEIPDNGIDDDNNGFIDDVRGWDFINSDGDPFDDEDHGTHVSGIASAVTNNAVGIAGVSWNSNIMPVKVLNSGGSGTDADVANGIVYAADNGADIINMSLGGPDTSFILQDAIDYAYENDCVIIAAAGNSGSYDYSYPASCDNVISVAATDNYDCPAFFSTRNPLVDVAAPGDYIVSSLPNNSYGSHSGTSMASPHVAGVAALILSKDPSLTNNEVVKQLYICADDLENDGWDCSSGFGRINAYKAVTSDTIDYLLARITEPTKPDERLRKHVAIKGTAIGKNFDHYEILVGKAEEPMNWQTTGITLTGGQIVDGALGEWDCSELEDGFWNIKLVCYDICGTTRQFIVCVELDNALEEGWPQMVEGEISDNFEHLAMVTGDVDNDGDLEIVTGSSFGYLYIWHHDGTLLTGMPVYLGRQMFTPALADLDKDGDLEVIIGIRGDGYQGARFFVLQHDGTSFGGDWPKGNSEEYGYTIDGISSCPLVCDIDNDGDYEILVGGREGTDWKLYAWHSDGTPVSGWPVHSSVSYWTSPNGISAGDIDGDGDMEIIAVEDPVVTPYPEDVLGNIYAWNHDGSTVPGWPIDKNGAWNQAVLGDIDNDGTLEIVISGGIGVCAFKGDGTILTGWPKSNGGFLSLGDIDNDNIPEVIALSLELSTDGHFYNSIYCWNGDGSNVSGWPTVLYSTERPFALGAVIGDVDGDECKEIITPVTDYDGNSYLYIFNHDGTFLNGYPKKRDIYYASTPAIADLEKDGNTELTAYGNTNDIYVLDMSSAYDETKADWPMYGHDARHTGCYPIATGKISGKVLLQNRADNSEIINFELRRPGQTSALRAFQVTTLSDGSYTLNDINIGTYDLTAKVNNSLREKIVNVTVTAGAETTNIDFNLIFGDCDNNNVINIFDNSILHGAFGSNPSSPNWDKRADLDNNNVINIFDNSILHGNFGKTGAE